jgi:hypothetical protein
MDYNLIIAVLIIFILVQLYYDGKLEQILIPIEKFISWLHYNINLFASSFCNCAKSLQEAYLPCPPDDCDLYKIRKDQLLIKNPFKWPFSGSDHPQEYADLEELNKIAAPRNYYYSPNLQSKTTYKCCSKDDLGDEDDNYIDDLIKNAEQNKEKPYYEPNCQTCL